MLNAFNKWYESPVIVHFASRSTPIWEIPFPAITICPETKLRQIHSNITWNYQSFFFNIDDLDVTDKE